jgi:hypothetical protein
MLSGTIFALDTKNICLNKLKQGSYIVVNDIALYVLLLILFLTILD